MTAHQTSTDLEESPNANPIAPRLRFVINTVIILPLILIPTLWFTANYFRHQRVLTYLDEAVAPKVVQLLSKDPDRERQAPLTSEGVLFEVTDYSDGYYRFDAVVDNRTVAKIFFKDSVWPFARFEPQQLTVERDRADIPATIP